MTCEHVRALLDTRESLDAQQQRLLEEHLASCLSCRFDARVLQDARALDEREEVPFAFTQALRQRITQEEEAPVKQSPRILKWLAVAACLAILVGGTYLAGEPRRQAVSASPPEKALGNATTYAEGYDANFGGQAPWAAMPESSVAADRSLMAREASPQEKIIRTARLELSTRSFDKDYENVLALVKEKGGRVESANLYNNYNDLRGLNLTLRIPVKQLDSVIASLKGVGRLVSFNESARDVSEQYYDMDARLQTQKTKMARLQELLQKAESVEDLIALEDSISNTQYELDRLTGSLKGLDSQVEDATLDLVLNELSPLETSQDQQEGLVERIKSGMAAAFRGFIQLLGDLVVFLSVILPYLIVVVAFIIIIRLIMKRRKNK